MKFLFVLADTLECFDEGVYIGFGVVVDPEACPHHSLLELGELLKLFE